MNLEIKGLRLLLFTFLTMLAIVSLHPLKQAGTPTGMLAVHVEHVASKSELGSDTKSHSMVQGCVLACLARALEYNQFSLILLLEGAVQQHLPRDLDGMMLFGPELLERPPQII